MTAAQSDVGFWRLSTTTATAISGTTRVHPVARTPIMLPTQMRVRPTLG